MYTHIYVPTYDVLYCIELYSVEYNAWFCVVAEARAHYNKIKCQVSNKRLVQR